MLQVPVIPHDGSEEEILILQIACPYETDVACDPSQEEIKTLYNHDEDDLQDEEESVCDADTKVFYDTFFSEIREMEELSSKSDTEKIVLKPKPSRVNFNDVKSHNDVGMTTLHNSIDLQEIFDSNNDEKESPSPPNSTTGQDIEKEISKVGFQESGIESCASHDESYASESLFSASTSSQSIISYSNSSILRLKARKRKLEKHLSKSLLHNSFSIREVKTTEEAPCTFVTVA